MMDNYEKYVGKLVYADGSKVRNTLQKYLEHTPDETGVIGYVVKDELMGYCLRVYNTCRYENGKVVEEAGEPCDTSASFLLRGNDIELVVLDKGELKYKYQVNKVIRYNQYKLQTYNGK